MFPTISHLVNYVFGTDFSWPVPTFGFFVTLAFILSYLTFKSEFKRKEELKEMKPYEERERWNITAKLTLVVGYGFLGFLVGFKVVGTLLDLDTFFYNPLRFIFSGQGNLRLGLLFAFMLCAFIIFANRKPLFSKTKKETIRLVSPQKLLPIMLLWSGIAGFIGAKLFNIFEDGSLHHSHTLFEILDFSGLTFWGGLIFGAFSYLFIGIRRGIYWKYLVDVGSLGMLVAYGVGRMGCHLSGDGDWGMVNTAEKPFRWLPDWMWSFRFPNNVLGQGEQIPGCVGKYCYVLPEGVFPTSFYEATIILLAFGLLWNMRRKIKVPGLLFAIYLFIAGAERILIECIRINYKFDIGGIYLSEAQLVGFFMAFLGFVVGGYLIFENRRLLKKSLTSKKI